MNKKFFVDIDLKDNQLLNAVLHSGDTSTIGSVLGIAGQIGYDSTTNQIKYYDSDTVNYLLDSEDFTTDFSSNVSSDIKMATVKAIADYYNSTGADGGAGEIGIEDDNDNFTATDVEGALIEISTSLDALDGAMNVTGEITTTGNYPSPGSIDKGDSWIVNNSSGVDIGPNTLSCSDGSLVVAYISGATNSDDDWFILDPRREQSSESILGLLKIATQAQANTGTDDTTAITPLKLKAYISHLSGATIYTATSVNLSTGTSVVTHGLGDNVNIQVWNDSEEITSGVKLTKTSNNVTVGVNTDPGGTTDVVVVGKVQ